MFEYVGGFRVEMQRDLDQPRTIVCRYDPTEPGLYAIQVMWSGNNIPGSPFLVQICGSMSELDRLTSADIDPPQFDGSRAVYSHFPARPD